MTETGRVSATTVPGSPISVLLGSRFVRFLLVGGLNTLFGYVMFLSVLWLGLPATPALVVAMALGMLFNFQTSRRMVFGTGGRGVLPAFVVVQGALLALNASCLHLLVGLGVAPWLAQGLLTLPMAATTYLAQSRLVFADRRRGAPRAAPLRASNRVVFVGASLFFLLPSLLFALQLNWLAAAVLLAGTCGAGALVAMRGAGTGETLLDQPLDGRRLALCAAAALLLLLLGGEGHVFFANWDWLWRDAVLADLAHGPFPPSYAVDGGDFVLRAPLGMYMLPAFVARIAGLGVGHAALLVQNAALLACVLYLLALVAGRRALLVVAIFLSFSGLDIIGQILRFLRHEAPVAAFYPPAHIESWTRFEYSSTVTQLFWVPNHALPCYWTALAALLCVLGELTIADFGLAMAAVLFWSPFAVIGALPFAIFVFLRTARASLRAPRFWLAGAAAVCFLPVAAYMQADAAKVPHGLQPMSLPFLAAMLQFLVLELPHVFVVRETWRELDGRVKGLVLVAIATLVCLPTMRIGLNNDLVMRASIPALTILAFAFAQGLDLAWPRRRSLCVLAFAIVGIGCVTPAMEVVRALVTPRLAISDCGFVTTWKQLTPDADVSNYLARAEAMPGWIGWAARPSGEPRACGPENSGAAPAADRS